MHPGMGLNREPNVLTDAQPGEEVGELEGAPDPEARPLRRAQAGHVLALDQNCAIGGAKLP